MESIILIAVILGLAINWYVKTLDRESDSLLVTAWKFFSYYTTLTNILVGVWMFLHLFKPSGLLERLVQDSNTVTAITFYIVTVGIANYIMFSLKGLDVLRKIADLSVHALVPIMVLLYWLLYVDKDTVYFQYLPYWLIYPLTYAAYTALHGRWTQFYPYPVVNVQALGAVRVFLNALGMTISVVFGGFLFVGLAKLLGGPLL